MANNLSIRIYKSYYRVSLVHYTATLRPAWRSGWPAGHLHIKRIVELLFDRDSSSGDLRHSPKLSALPQAPMRKAFCTFRFRSLGSSSPSRPTCQNVMQYAAPPMRPSTQIRKKTIVMARSEPSVAIPTVSTRWPAVSVLKGCVIQCHQVEGTEVVCQTLCGLNSGEENA